jgi:hypothetical protein
MVKADGPEATRADSDPESATRATRPLMPRSAWRSLNVRFFGEGRCRKEQRPVGINDERG